MRKKQAEMGVGVLLPEAPWGKAVKTYGWRCGMGFICVPPLQGSRSFCGN